MPAHRSHPNSDRRLSNLDREWIVSSPSIYQGEMYVLPIPLVDCRTSLHAWADSGGLVLTSEVAHALQIAIAAVTMNAKPER